METKGKQPKWKGDGCAVWEWEDGRISIKLVGHDYINAFLQDDRERPIPKKQEEVIVNG